MRRDLAAELRGRLPASVAVTVGRRIEVRWDGHLLQLTAARAADLLVWLPPVPSPASLDVLQRALPRHHLRARLRRGLRWLTQERP